MPIKPRDITNPLENKKVLSLHHTLALLGLSMLLFFDNGVTDSMQQRDLNN